MIETQAGVLPCRQRARHCSDRLPGRRLRAGDGGDQVQASGRILLGLSELSGSSAALMARITVKVPLPTWSNRAIGTDTCAMS